MKTIKDYYSIKTLWDMKINVQMAGCPLFGYANNGKGNSFYLNSCNNIKHLSILELLPELGARGGHYHKKKLEMIYVISGEAVFKFWLPKKKLEAEICTVKSGDFITIYPGIAHEFKGIEPATLLEMSPHRFDPNDNFYPVSGL